MDLSLIQRLVKPADTKIVLLVMDGLGGHPQADGVSTELETAVTPLMDKLAENGICGLHSPLGPGITPGSGPAHLALFGYDPVLNEVGRGVLAGSGIGFDLKPGDVAARGNFCTIDKQGRVVDRRAGRIQTKMCAELCRKLAQIELPDVKVFVEPVKDYRFLLVLRGEYLSEKISDTDPLQIGLKRLTPEPLHPDARFTADLAKQFSEKAEKILAGQHPANGVLLRGFSIKPGLQGMRELFALSAAATAAYPMYRGVARLVGMEVLACAESIDAQIDAIEKHWKKFDFFFLHVKNIDSAGEDGDFEKKVALIEKVDEHVQRLIELQPDVLVVTGDHSTPASLKNHSWHPVPILLYSKVCRPDPVDRFAERECRFGYLGPNFSTLDLMPLMLANAMRLRKFGA